MRIFVQEESGDTSCLIVEPTDTVAAVKDKIETSLGFAPSSQMLHFADFPLVDSQTLADANIQHRGTLNLVISAVPTTPMESTPSSVIPPSTGAHMPSMEDQGSMSITPDAKRICSETAAALPPPPPRIAVGPQQLHPYTYGPYPNASTHRGELGGQQAILQEMQRMLNAQTRTLTSNIQAEIGIVTERMDGIDMTLKSHDSRLSKTEEEVHRNSKSIKEHSEQLASLQSEMAKLRTSSSHRASSVPSRPDRPHADREAFLGGFPNMSQAAIRTRASSVIGNPTGLEEISVPRGPTNH
eukprot:6497718-Karenia_brevis.AAC.1